MAVRRALRLVGIAEPPSDPGRRRQNGGCPFTDSIEFDRPIHACENTQRTGRTLPSRDQAGIYGVRRRSRRQARDRYRRARRLHPQLLRRHSRFRLRITDGDLIAVGPGKVALLEAIRKTGSITAAAKSLDMSYRRAWLLLDEMNRSLREPAVESAKGGASGGSSVVTEAGQRLIALYRYIEKTAEQACQARHPETDGLVGTLSVSPRSRARRRCPGISVGIYRPWSRQHVACRPHRDNVG
jgi:molybdate transport system regulatory protein